MNRTILVIGANSALAKEAIKSLSKENDMLTAGRKDCDISCDITSEFKIPAEIDIIINFAASYGGDGDEGILEAVKTNVGGLLNICIAAKEASVSRIINISTAFALNDENSNFYSVYSITKKQGDELASYYCQLNNIALTILRPTRIYGDNSDFEKNQPFFYQIINKAQNGEDISIYGNNDAKRNYIHSSDLVEIIDRVINKEIDGTYLCSFPINTSYNEVALSAQKIFDKGGKVAFIKDKPDIPDDDLILNTELYKKISFEPKITVNIGIERIKKFREAKSS